MSPPSAHDSSNDPSHELADSLYELTALLERFDASRRPGPFEYARHHHHDGGEHDFHVVIGAIVHGDEVGSLPSLVSLVEALTGGTIGFGGRLTVILGNPEASAENRRFLGADLNRVFIEDPPACHEGDRARELKPILDQADVFLDLHQTILQTGRPFYTFPFGIAGWQWARAIGGASTWVTRAPAVTFSAGTCCADEYVRNRGKAGLTLELGQKGFNPESEKRATETIGRLLTVADAVGANPAALGAMAEAKPDLEFIHTTWRQPFEDARMKLRPGLINFESVTAGERLSAEGCPLIEAPHDGLVLFPKYPAYDPSGAVLEPRPGEIVNLAQPLADHPTEVWAAELSS